MSEKRVSFRDTTEDAPGPRKRRRDEENALIQKKVDKDGENEEEEEAHAELEGGPFEDFDEKGEQFTSFNLSEEREEDGYFDEKSGSFVWKKREAARARRSGLKTDEDEEEEEDEEGIRPTKIVRGHKKSTSGGEGDEEDDSDTEKDAWLDGLTDMEGAERRRIQLEARKAQSQRIAKQQSIEEILSDPPHIQRALALHTLWRFLLAEEDVASALRRLGGSSKNVRRPKKQTFIELVSPQEPPIKEAPRDLTVFNKVTEAADLLLRNSMTTVFSLTRRKAGLEISDALADAGLSRAQFDALLVSRGLTENAPVPAIPPSLAAPTSPPLLLPVGISYEFMWAGDTSGKVHGPEPAENMNAWLSAGYFSMQAALFREAGGGGGWEPLHDSKV